MSGRAATTMSAGAVLAQEIRRQHLDRGVRAARADRADDGGEVRCPAIVEIVAIDRGDDDMASPSFAVASATCAGSAASSAPGSPVLTLQKAQARVQVSPMIMKVACFFSQHSPILGQPASSHTVCRPFSRTMLLGLEIAARDRRLDADPVGLAQGRLIRPMRLFRMAGPAGGAAIVSIKTAIMASRAINPCCDTYEAACCAARRLFRAQMRAPHEQTVTKLASVPRSTIELLPQ